jgi:hypothetical protein
VHVSEIKSIQILLKDYSNFAEDLFFEISINRTVPCDILGSLMLPAKIASWRKITNIAPDDATQ